MAGQDISLSEAIGLGVDARLDDVFVARPGNVTAYDPLTNTAVVKPAVKRAIYGRDDGERSFIDLPEIPFVPVIFPRAGAYAISLPVEVGDSVLLVFCDVSLAEWRASGEVSEPVDARRHSIGWPVAILGLFPDTSPLSPDPIDLVARAAGLVVGEHAGGGRIEITPTEIKLGKAATDFVALAALVATELGKIRTAFNAHVHTSAAAGSPTTPPTAPLAALSSVAASRAKAE